MIFLGGGEVFGSLIIGYIRDHYGYKITLVVEIGLLIAIYATCIIFNALNKWHPSLGFIMCLFWGL